MSLQVWLPLTKDLRNQGLSDLTFSITSSTETTVDNNGKLGKCYSQSSLNGSGGLISNKTIDLGQNQSMFCWFKFVDLTSASSLGGGLVSQHRYPSNQGMGITIKYISSTTGYLSVNTGTGSSRTFNTYCGTTLLQANTWYHGGYTYDGSTLKIYINGNCEKTQAITGMSVPADYISCFNWSMASSSGAGLYSGYKLHGSLNDVRIYDHCLSPTEVKELSKGLVLHYPLNRQGWGQENLWSQTENASLTAANASVFKIENGGFTATASKNDFYTTGILYNTTSYYQANNGQLFTLDSTSAYTLTVTNSIFNSALITYLDSNKKGLGYKVLSKSSLYTDKSVWIILTSMHTSGAAYFLIRVGYTASVAGETYSTKIKLEKGSIATPWCPNVADVNNMGLNGTTEYDCSGFCNNGSKMTDTITYTSDTAKYQVSTHFNGTYDGILIENLQLSNIINTAVTYAFWVKPEGESGARSVYFGSYSGTSWSIEKTSGNILRLYWNASPDETCLGATITDGVWQHVCITKNGTSDIKVYINGVQKWSSTATHSNLSFPTTYRIGRDVRSNDGTPYKGLMSDFRIYATALSADDVKSLYNNNAYIDSSGTIYGQIR